MYNNGRYNGMRYNALQLPVTGKMTSGPETVTLTFAVMVGEWEAVPGLPYLFRVGHLVHGAGQGRVVTEENGTTRLRSASQTGTLVRRRYTGTAAQEQVTPWESVEKVGSDAHGHWHSTSQPGGYYSGTRRRVWEYGVMGANAEVQVIGQLAPREYGEAYYWPQYLLEPWVRRGAEGETWVAARDDASTGSGNVYCLRYHTAENMQGTQTAARPLEGAYRRPCVALGDDGSLTVTAHNTATDLTETVVSRDGGATWEVPA